MFVDHYAILCVDPTADAVMIKQAYRARVKECHPDRNPGCVETLARFQQVQEALRVLGNEQARRNYDREREAYLALAQAQAEDSKRFKTWRVDAASEAVVVAPARSSWRLFWKRHRFEIVASVLLLLFGGLTLYVWWVY